MPKNNLVNKMKTNEIKLKSRKMKQEVLNLKHIKFHGRQIERSQQRNKCRNE